MKICEGCGISLAMYVNGHVRQRTGSYFGVSLVIMSNAILGGTASLYLNHLSSLPKEDPEHLEEESSDRIAERYAYKKVKKTDDPEAGDT